MDDLVCRVSANADRVPAKLQLAAIAQFADVGYGFQLTPKGNVVCSTPYSHLLSVLGAGYSAVPT